MKGDFHSQRHLHLLWNAINDLKTALDAVKKGGSGLTLAALDKRYASKDEVGLDTLIDPDIAGISPAGAHTHDAADIVSGILAAARIPGLDASKIITGLLADARFQTIGTWTPGLAFNGSSTGITYGIQDGSYIKTGRHVHVEGRIQLTNKGTATGGAQITGVPFAAANTHLGVIDTLLGFTGMNGSGFPICSLAGSTITFLIATTTGHSTLAETFFTNTAEFHVTLDYRSST